MTQLTRERIQESIERVTEVADAEGYGTAVAVTDPSGRLAGTLRGDGANYLGMEVAIKKAATAAAFGVPTQELTGMAEDELVARVAGSVDDMVTVPGGFPIHEGEEVVGGVGITAGHYTRNQEIGEKAIPDHA